MNLVGKVIGNRYEMLEKIGEWWYGHSIQSTDVIF